MPFPSNEDLIWLIANTNASDTAYGMQSRLATTRIMSQVCQRWRDVILGSASMWGRLILLDSKEKTEWIQEVLKRAGDSSLLWIELRITDIESEDPAHSPIFSCVLDILRDWKRIEVLRILPSNSTPWTFSPYAESIWEHMTQPAPNLRSFCIANTFSIGSSLASTFPSTLFANCAPRLREFSCYGLNVNFQAPWVSNLETLEFSPVSLNDMSKMLISAPRLQSLGIKPRDPNCFNVNTGEDLAILRYMSQHMLHRLTTFYASMPLPAFSALWSTYPISPAIYSSNIAVDDEDEHVSGTSGGPQEQIQNALYSIFHYHYTSNNASDPFQPTRWSLHIESNGTSLGASSPATKEREPVHSYLRFKCGQSMIRFLLKAFTSYLRNAMGFDLWITAIPTNIDSPEKDVDDLLLTMTEVTSITVNTTSIRFYNRIDNTRGLLFPKLKTVRCIGNVYSTEEYRDQVLFFFEKRAKDGRGLPFVYTYESNKDDMIRDLDRVCGPRIKWGLSDECSKTSELRWSYVS